ncbi:MAG: aldo/keto reductase [Clostridia bacterium]|nr:aldo/keto reductase [Clostridia bacterium]
MYNVNLSTYPQPFSCFCLGTASMGSAGLVGEPLDKAFAILDTYYAMGGRFLDTANVYGRWGVDRTNASEIAIGRWLKERQITDMVVTTKACHYMPDAPKISRVTDTDMERDIEESRRSMGMDRLDICLLHRDNEETDIRTIVDFCIRQVDAGKVLRYGFSNYRTDRVKTAIEYMGEDWQKYFVGVSNEWSLAMENAEGYNPPDGMQPVDMDLRQLAAEKGFGIFPFSSAAHGFFAKLQMCGAVYENGCWSGTEEFRGRKEWLTAANGEAYNKLLAESRESGESVNTCSIRYLLKQTNTIPVMSVSRPEQLAELANL